MWSLYQPVNSAVRHQDRWNRWWRATISEIPSAEMLSHPSSSLSFASHNITMEFRGSWKNPRKILSYKTHVHRITGKEKENPNKTKQVWRIWAAALPTSKWLTFMYSQTRLSASERIISFSPVPKNFESASEITTEDEPLSLLTGAGSTSTFTLLAWLAPSAYNRFKFLNQRYSITKMTFKFTPRYILVGSRAVICFASSLFILNMSVQSVSNTNRNASSQIIFLLLLGSWRLFFLMYAQSCFTIWNKHNISKGLQNTKELTANQNR